MTAVASAGASGYHVFITHDWGEDELGRKNHERVAAINNGLKELGIITWFDEDRLDGAIQEEMAEGIDRSQVVICCVTKRYEAKVTSKNDNGRPDNCKYEFKYAVNQKGVAKMLTVVMEEGMKQADKWKGILGGNLGGELYVSAWKDEYPTICSEIVSRLSARIPGLKSYLERQRIAQEKKKAELAELCAYSSENGHCRRKRSPDGDYCVSHQCPEEGCRLSKASSALVCVKHSESRAMEDLEIQRLNAELLQGAARELELLDIKHKEEVMKLQKAIKEKEENLRKKKDKKAMEENKLRLQMERQERQKQERHRSESIVKGKEQALQQEMLQQRESLALKQQQIMDEE